MNDIGMAWIYCNYNERDKQTVHDLIASLLKQLVQDNPIISEGINSLYEEHHRKNTHPSLAELADKLGNEVGRYYKAFIIVDALDELVERDRKPLIDQIQSVAKKANLLITSRPLPMITRIFQDAKSIDIRADDRDVQKYIEDRISRAPRLSLFAEDRTLHDYIIDKMRENVQGMCVYLTLSQFIIYSPHCQGFYWLDCT